MKVLIVYDSAFGNTEQIARAMGDALRSPDDAGIVHDANIVRAGSARPDQLKGLDFLIVGSPTQGFRATEAMTQFLAGIPDRALNGVKVAAFDTRFSIEDTKNFALRLLLKKGGFAAKPIAEVLVKKGGELIVPPEGFIVKDKKGPLKQGELERAAAWARQVVAAQAVAQQPEPAVA